MTDRRVPSDKILAHDAWTIENAAGGPIDIAIVLGSGLSTALTRTFPHAVIPYDLLLGVPVAPLTGHAGEALVGTMHGKRVLAFAGRVHLYQGFSAQQVTVCVRLAQATGAQRLILTNAAGSLNPEYGMGDLMLLSDHINLTGRNPLMGVPIPSAFVDMANAYSPRLREIARAVARPEHRLHEGVYVGMAGPTYETGAEARYLHRIGGDAVGMSTVLETIQARTLDMEVMGLSVLTNSVGTTTTHNEVTNVANAGAERMAEIIDGTIERL